MPGGSAAIRRARLGTLFDYAAERHPDQQVIDTRASDVDPDRPLAGTYASWAQYVAELSGRLSAAGVGRSDRVAIFKGNHSDVIALTCAAARLGAVPAPLAWTHGPEVIETLLRRLERPVLISDRARLESARLGGEQLRALTARTIVVDGAPEGAGPEVVSLASFAGAGVPEPFVAGDDEPMVILHTSGTTGVPKLAVHSTRTIAEAAHYETRRIPFLRLSRRDTVAFCDPFFHGRLTTGLVGAARWGPKLLLLADPDPDTVRDPLVEHAPTIVETVPNAFIVWERFARDPARPLRRVRLFFNSFDPIHARTVRILLGASERRMPVWVQAYGQSECGPVTIGLYTRRSVRPGRAGRVAQARGFPVSPGTRLRAVDPATGTPLRRGRMGILHVRRRPCLGYLGEPDRWEAKRSGNWWNLGDLGVVTRTGEVRLIDREVDRIAGDASCIELESTLLERLESATEVIVLGVRDGLPVPVVSTADGEPLSSEQWAAATADLPPLADPIVMPWDDLPRTATWKVRRNVLREELLPGAATAGTGRWT